MENKNIIIVDDYLVVRKGIELIVKESLPSCNVYCADSYEELLKVLSQVKAGMVLLDINMYGEENIGIIAEIKNIQPTSKILVFSSYDEKKYGLRYIKAGANGYLNKSCTDELLVEAITTILEKGYYYSENLRQNLEKKSSKSNKNLIDKLSNREFEVFNLMINGYGSLEISNKLDIHMSTVSTLKNRMFQKLNIKNIVELLEFSNSMNEE